MAKKQATKGAKRVGRSAFAKTLCSVTILTCCAVLFIGGIDEGVRTSKIIYTCLATSAVIGVAFWVVIKAVESYEEINGG